MARQYYYVERAAEVTRTSSTFADVTDAVLTFTPDASSTYLILWTCLSRTNSATAGGSQVRLRDDTGGVTLGLHRGVAKDITDYISKGGAYIFTTGGSPASQTFSIEHASEDNTTTIGTKEARIIAIKLVATDLSVTELAEETNNTTSFVTKTSLVANPGASTDYLIIAAATVYNNDDAGDPFAIKLTDATNNWGLMTQDNYANDGAPADGGGPYSWMTMVKRTVSSSTTFSIQYRNTVGTDIIGCQYSAIVALDLSAMPDQNYAEARARTTTTNTSASPVTKVTVTDDFANVAGVMLGVALLDHSATTSSVNARLTEGGVNVAADMVREPQLAGTNGNYPFMMMKQETLPEASTDWDIDFFAEAVTSGIQEAAVVVLQLADTPGGATVGVSRRMLTGVGI